MVKVIVEGVSEQPARDLAGRVRRDGIGASSTDTDAARIVRVPEDAGVLFHPSGPARVGGYDHLGLDLLELEE